MNDLDSSAKLDADKSILLYCSVFASDWFSFAEVADYRAAIGFLLLLVAFGVVYRAASSPFSRLMILWWSLVLLFYCSTDDFIGFVWADGADVYGSFYLPACLVR